MQNRETMTPEIVRADEHSIHSRQCQQLLQPIDRRAALNVEDERVVLVGGLQVICEALVARDGCNLQQSEAKDLSAPWEILSPRKNSHLRVQPIACSRATRLLTNRFQISQNGLQRFSLRNACEV